jgi:hypothetical protein
MSRILSDRFIKELNKRNLVVDHKEGETFFLMSVVEPSRKTTFMFFSIKRHDKRKYGSHNDTPIKSIGVFSFKQSSPKANPDFYIFPFDNSFVIIPVDILHSRISRLNHGHLNGDKIQLVLWLLLDGHLFDATNIGVEGDWYFMGGGMARGTDMDYTSYLDNWDLLTKKDIQDRGSGNF